MLGKIFGILVLVSYIFAGATGNMINVCNAAIIGAGEAVQLSISLLGIMCLWSGIIRVLDKAGLTKLITKIISPFLKFLYPDAHKKNINTDYISANYSANLLGLGNAALPIGISAIKELKKEGLPAPQTANNDMVTFAVLNTTPIQLIPTTLIALRTTYNSANPYEIILPIWICSLATTIFGAILCKIMSKYYK